MFLTIWFLVVLLALCLYFREIYSRFSKYGVKHFTPLPLFGHMLKMLLKREHLADQILRTYSSFPDERFVGRYAFIAPVLLIRDLELIKNVTVKDYEHFLDHRTVVDEDIDPFFGKNLLSLKGQKWKDMRSTLSPAFTSSKIRLMLPFMVEEGQNTVNSIRKQMEASGRDFIDIESKDLLTRYANDVIANCAFGLKVDSHSDKHNEFYEMAKSSSTLQFKHMLKFFGYFAFPTIMKKLKIPVFNRENTEFYSDLVLSTMNIRRMNNIKRHDMIHLLMEAKKGSLIHDEKNVDDASAGFATVQESEVGKKKGKTDWSDDELIAQAAIFFIAGFDTVSTAAAFLLHELALNPDVQEKLHDEILKNHKTNFGKLDYEIIQHMKYMDMVVSESLRLWSPAIATDRVCTKDYNLGKANVNSTRDYIVRKGEAVSIPVWGIHRNPEYYQDPLKFDPERFSDENKNKIRPYTYLPFGLGPRNCIGSRFALCEIKVIIYYLILHLEISPGEKTSIPAELVNSIFNIQIKGGHWIRLKQRSL